MATIEVKSAPDQTVELPDGSVIKHMQVGGNTVTFITAKPGWKWSEHVKPRVCTETCEKEHIGYLISGRLACQMTGQDVVVFEPGNAFHIPPDHDGWVVGDEEVTMLEFTPKAVTPYAVKAA